MRASANRRPAAVVTTMLAVLVGLALPVLAAQLLAVKDRNDTPGLLDVHEVRFRDSDGSPPSWTVITFNDWTAHALWDRGYVLLNLDTSGSRKSDYYVLVRADRDRLLGSMWRDRSGRSDHRLFDVAVHKRGGGGVEVQVPLRRLSIGAHRSVYRWAVTTLFSGGACRRTCVDLAPDLTMVEQPLSSGSTPSPTSPSATST